MPTQKIFIAVAAMINGMYKELDSQNGAVSGEDVIRQITQKFCKYFASENPKFDKEKFLKACLKEVE